MHDSTYLKMEMIQSFTHASHSQIFHISRDTLNWQSNRLAVPMAQLYQLNIPLLCLWHNRPVRIRTNEFFQLFDVNSIDLICR